MGRTNPTMRDQLRSLEEDEWNDYKRVLRRQNQPIFDELWEDARRHADAIGMVNPRRPMEGVLLSVAIEQQREIHDLQEELESVKDEVGVIAGRIESLEDEPVGLDHRKSDSV
jgi:hypothetical protein